MLKSGNCSLKTPSGRAGVDLDGVFRARERSEAAKGRALLESQELAGGKPRSLRQRNELRRQVLTFQQRPGLAREAGQATLALLGRVGHRGRGDEPARVVVLGSCQYRRAIPLLDDDTALHDSNAVAQ